MTSQSWLVGTDPACDIVVQSDVVSGKHCRLTCRDDIYELEDLGSTNGTYVNGELLSSPMTVTPRDTITLGQRCPFPWPGTDTPVPRETPRPKEPQRTTPREITLGRASDNSVVLDQSNVSSYHAKLTVTDDSIQLDDLGSTNGTYVGDLTNKIRRAKVKPKDTIYLGTSPFKVADLIAKASAPRGPIKKGLAQPTSSLPLNGSQIALIAAGVVCVLLIPLLVWNLVPTSNDQTDASETVAQTDDSSTDSSVPVSEPPPEPADETRSAPDEPVTLSDEERLAQCLFLVICRDRDQETPFRLGTAFAIDEHHVATSGSVIQAMNRFQQTEFSEIILYSPANQTELTWSDSRVHAEFERLSTEFDAAQDRYETLVDTVENDPPATEQERVEVERQLHPLRDSVFELLQKKAVYDVGVIRVSDPLPHFIAAPKSTGSLRPNQKLNVVGYAYDALDPYYDANEPIELLRMPSRIKQLPSFSRDAPQWVFAQGSSEQMELAYVGGPALNLAGEVVAVYSRPLPLIDEQTNEPVEDLFDAALFQRVAECLEATP